MVTKTLKIDPRISNDRVGLIISRQQVKTLAHAGIESQMMIDNSVNIMGLGSCEKHGVEGNPLTADQKRIAHQGIWGSAFKICMLQDIGATDRTADWGNYVLDRIARNQLPEPTDLYSGSKHEARWYEAHFASLKGEPTFTRGRFNVWENPETGKRIHILDRTEDGISSSEARMLIERRDPAWMDMVPAKLWNYYEQEYPPHLRVAIEVDPTADRDPQTDFPKGQPVGTKCIYIDDPERVFILRDDGKWRARSDSENRKSMGD